MSYHNRNSSRSGASPIIKDILRGALDALTEPSSSSSSRRDRDPPAPRRTATQPEPRRHRDGDTYTGIPSHSYSHHENPRTSTRSSSNSDDLKDMLGKAAIELSRLVSNFEQRLKPRKNTDPNRVNARPGEFANDDERFEVLDDTDAETYHNTRSQPFQQQQQQQQPGLANEYYFPEYLPGYQQPQAPAYSPNPTNHQNPTTPNPTHMNYHHPQPIDPTYADYHHPADARPKPKRSSTSTSQTMRKVGSEILQNLPQLLERAGWLLKVLDGQQKRSGGSRSITGYSGLLMALNLVMELYRQFGGDKRERGERGERGGRSRERERERERRW